ncbi:MAG: response regulator [Candidatus Hydrogenedentes bacterium]|nr:response regulator [Candidatus Hydrogenedentota bacterium]
MAGKHILVVDDEADILELVRYNLDKAKFTCTCETTGNGAVTTARSVLPDLIVLDLMLPGRYGLEVCSILKDDSKTRHIPIVMLTAKGSEGDIVRGLEAGADDYITKPFSPKVLVARIGAVLRRQPKNAAGEDDAIRAHGIVIHPGRHEVLIEGQTLELTPTEFRTLYFLARRPGWVFTRSQVVDAVHGAGHPVTDRSVDVQIVGLRRKLGSCEDCIETVRGIGYRFRE